MSLACCVLLLVAWPLSYWASWVITWNRHRGLGTLVMADVNRGTVMVVVEPKVRSVRGPLFEIIPAEPIDWGVEMGRRAALGLVYSDGTARMAWCPLWFLAMLTMIPPALWWRGRRASRARGFEVGATVADDPGTPDTPGAGAAPRQSG